MFHLLFTVGYMDTALHPNTTFPAGPSGVSAPRTRLVTGQLALLLLASLGALTSFELLLSVTPMDAESSGAGSSEAGLVTASLMLATVLAELASARLIGRYGDRLVFAAGAMLLGGPALALLAPHAVALIVAVSIARGIGFGLNTVVIGALVATAVPAERRGEGIGMVGVVDCIPAIVALPSGVWLAEHAGYAVVIVITAACGLAPLAVVPWLGSATKRGQPARHADAADLDPAPQAGLLASLRSPASAARHWCSRRRRSRPGWSPRSCRWRPASPAASRRSGCSCRASRRRQDAGGPGATVTSTVTLACSSPAC